MDIRQIREAAIGAAGGWTAIDIDGKGSWALRCGDVEVCTVNERKTRIFRSLPALRRTLKEELGATEFRMML